MVGSKDLWILWIWYHKPKIYHGFTPCASFEIFDWNKWLFALTCTVLAGFSGFTCIRISNNVGSLLSMMHFRIGLFCLVGILHGKNSRIHSFKVFILFFIIPYFYYIILTIQLWNQEQSGCWLCSLFLCFPFHSKNPGSHWHTKTSSRPNLSFCLK